MGVLGGKVGGRVVVNDYGSSARGGGADRGAEDAVANAASIGDPRGPL